MEMTSHFLDALVQFFAQLHHLGIYAGTLFSMIPMLPVFMHVSVLRSTEWLTAFSSVGLGIAIDYVQLTDTATLILGILVVVALIALVVQVVRMLILADRVDRDAVAHLDRQLLALQQDRPAVGLRDHKDSR